MAFITKICNILQPQNKIVGFLTQRIKFSTEVSWQELKNMKFGVNINNDVGTCETHLPGLVVDDFSFVPEYELRAWRILNHLDGTRRRMFDADYLCYKKLTQTHLTYIYGITFERLLPIEKILQLAKKPYDFSMNMLTSLTCMGTTSFQFDHEVLADIDGTDQSLYNSSVVVVCVDTKTRKVSSLPQWWTDRFGPLAKSPEKSPKKLFPLKHPSTDSFTQPLLVTALDLDYYGHATNTAYLRFGIDCIYGAFKTGAFQENKYEGDALARIKKMELVLLKECNMGDKLTGRVWTEGENIYCIVQDEQGNDLYHQTMVLDMPKARNM